MHIHTYTDIWCLYMHVFAYICMYLNVYVCIPMYMHVYVCICMYIAVYACIYVYACICIYARIFMYIHVYMYMNVSECICMYICVFKFFFLSGQDKEMPALRGNMAPEMYWQKAVQNDAKRHIRFQDSNTRLHSKRG